MGTNRLCDLIGIRYPIIQSPMSWVSGVALAAAVSNAGGLGTLGLNTGVGKVSSCDSMRIDNRRFAGFGLSTQEEAISADVLHTGERLRSQIRNIKNITRQPFAVNIIIGTGDTLKYSKKYSEIVMEEAVPVVITSAGKPDVYTSSLQAAKIKVFHSVSTPTHARKAEAAGVNGVVCTGYEAGGHKSFDELTTMVLVPMVADAVNIPVVAGGGIGDVRGVIAALALGADAVYMGTRFMVTQESESHQRVKEAILQAQDVCTVSIPKGYMMSRQLQNTFTKTYMKMQKAGKSKSDLAAYYEKHSQLKAQHLGDAEGSVIGCGQVAGLINDIPRAAEVIEEIIQSFSSVIENVNRKWSHKIY